MATFTIRVADLVDWGFDFGLKPVDYPIFDEIYRDTLNDKILKHYWMYEIGQETDSLFRMSLNRKMNEVMPYYNQLYLSEKIVFDPLKTVNYTDIAESSEAHTASNEATGSGNTTNTDTTTGDTVSDTDGKSRSVSSTTPQVQLSGDEDYASNAADVNSNSHVTGNSTSTTEQTAEQSSTQNLLHNDSGSGTIDRTVNGLQGNASDLLMSYRATFLNIDMQVIRDLEPLFMQVWDNGDEFTRSNSDIMNWGSWL